MTTIDGPPRRYRIAEVAQLSGFTPSALRFYEQAGVIAPPERTASGYRSYDERDVERLQLIARAKELGCTLEETADLVQAWDDDECAPVKHRLRSLVGTKITAVHDHIAEQTAFAAQLQATAAALADRPVDGPCDDTCGCTAPTPEADEPPISCSLSGSDVADRIDEWQTVLAGVVRREPLDGGVRLEFGASAPLAEIARLAAAEHACCPFFGFAVTVDGRGIALEVTAATDGQELLAAVFGSAG